MFSLRLRMCPLLLNVFAVALLFYAHISAVESQANISNVFTRSSFPHGFVFGAASSAFQYEGAVREDGRKPSIWDAFAHTPGKIKDGSTADVAVDHYHRYKEDIGLLAAAGADAYRFSISWSRIIPDGRGPVNQKGIDHYNKVINEVFKKGLKPYVTIFHWDVPLALERAYGGTLSPQFVKDFAVFSEVLFEAFGDRVKNWITLNEPHIFAVLGYNFGVLAPGRCSSDLGNCTSGDSAREPYIVGHHLLLAHASVTAVYNKKFKAKQGGEIGIALDSQYYEPFSNSRQDKKAAEKTLEFNLGWFLSPIIYGDYPVVMRASAGSRLPSFTPHEAALLKGSADFVGINHYRSLYAADARSNLLGAPDFLLQQNATFYPVYYKDFTGVSFTDRRGGRLIGQNIIGFPHGIRKLMNFIRIKYKNPKVYITENGITDITNDTVPLKQALQDSSRVDYLQNYLMQLAIAIREGCNVQAYFVWSFLDNWEWNSGFVSRFGIVHIDYKNHLKRIPKASYYWYQHFLQKHF